MRIFLNNRDKHNSRSMLLSMLLVLCGLLVTTVVQSQLFSNITINTSATANGTWTGSGTLASPWLFTPTATTSNILNTDLNTKLSSGHVKIVTNYSTGTGTSGFGTVTFASAVTGTSANSTDKTFTIIAQNTITISASLILNSNTDAANNTYKIHR